MKKEINIANNDEHLSLLGAFTGCNQAVFTYGINRNGKLSRIVTAYNTNELSFEEAIVGATESIQHSDFVLTKSIVYDIKDENLIKENGIVYPVCQFKEISGFVPNETIINKIRK